MKNKKLIIAILFPIILLGLITMSKHIKYISGEEFIIPIRGFDPRDLLSGHYLIYQIDYGNDGCNSSKKNDVAYMCLQKDKDKYDSEVVYGRWELHDCLAYIAGRCKYGQFKAGIERFYIPQEHAYKLDRVVRKKKGKIVLSITKSGKAVVKDLLIDDLPWREYLENN